MNLHDGFDLRALIREVCDSSTITDPSTLAKEVGKRIGRNHQREALEQALPILVLNVVSRSRGAQSPSGDHGRPDSRRSSVAGRSKKVEGIRSAWKRMLRDRISVGPDLGDWKFLADCDADDLAYAAQIREDHARANMARAEQLRHLADLLTEHGVSTVGELSDDLGHELASAA